MNKLKALWIVSCITMLLCAGGLVSLHYLDYRP
ncbi:hypothetical protein LCGC14_1556800, partial [marine sediment metagenome]